MITNLTGTRSHHFRSRQAGKTSLPIALSERHVYNAFVEKCTDGHY